MFDRLNLEETVSSAARSLTLLFLIAAGHTTEGGQTPKPHAQPLSRRLVGQWSLVAFEMVSGTRAEYPFGRDATGQLTYDAAGRMSVQIMKAGRPTFSSGDRAAGTAEETVAAFRGYDAYYGTYRVDERAGVVTHRLTGSLYPNWVGSEQRRQIVLEGDRLTLSTPPIPFRGEERVFRLVWKRLE